MDCSGKLPLFFEANRGQTDAHVKFLSRGSGYTLFLTPAETVLVEGRTQVGSRPWGSARLLSDSKSAPAVFRIKLADVNP